MSAYQCTRCGNTIMIGNYHGEVCPIDQGTLMPKAATPCQSSTTESKSDTNAVNEKIQVILNG